MTMKVRVLYVAAVLVGSLWLTGCDHYNCGVTFGNSSCSSSSGTGVSQSGGSGSNGQAAVYLYFENAGNIDAASVDTSGNFALIPNFVSPTGTLSGTGNMIIVQKQWLYEPLTGGLSILSYSIDATTGALTTITGGPFASADSNAITSDPAGKFVFVCGADNDEVSVFSIDQTSGALTFVGKYAANVGFAEQATTDGQGKFLYVTAGNLGGSVAVFSIGSTGALTPAAGSPFSISIAQLQGEPTGKFLLGITGNGANNGFANDNHVYVYAINQTTGVLTAVSGSPFSTQFTPATFSVHPSGSFVFTYNQTVTTSEPMEGFGFNSSTGAITELGTSPFTAFTPFAGQFDQNGTYLFMHSADTFTVASVDTSSGAVTSVGLPITGAGSLPTWAVTDP